MKKPRRARKVPIQVYVNDEERAALRRIAKRRGTTVAVLVRGWICRSAAAARAREEPRPAPEDPRQLKLA